MQDKIREIEREILAVSDSIPLAPPYQEETVYRDRAIADRAEQLGIRLGLVTALAILRGTNTEDEFERMYETWIDSRVD